MIKRKPKTKPKTTIPGVELTNNPPKVEIRRVYLATANVYKKFLFFKPRLIDCFLGEIRLSPTDEIIPNALATLQDAASKSYNPRKVFLADITITYVKDTGQ